MTGIQLLARKHQFSCVHKYQVDEWDDETNQKTFGPCFSKYGHGHNYTLEVWYSGPVDQETGMIVNLTVVDEMIRTALKSVDGKNLNSEVEYFSGKVPTTENLLSFVKSQLEQQLSLNSPVSLHQLRLYESDDLWVDWIRQ